MPTAHSQHPSSYRDPSGFIFKNEGIYYRQINLSYKEHFDHLISSGLYQSLVAKNLLIPHEEINENLNGHPLYYKCTRPAQIPFISYPYEWCFDMQKDAALLTLQLAKESLALGMMLKDAPAYNIQWLDGRLVFIDTLSFEKYEEGSTWIAYRQFCEQFLAPLLLTHYTGMPVNEMLLAYPEGIPVKLCASLLPFKSKLNLYTYLHIHLHSRIAAKPGGSVNHKNHFSKTKLLNLLNSLESLVKSLRLKNADSTWSAYYEEAETRSDYLQQKKKIVKSWIDASGAKTAADLGANEGEFSALLAAANIQSIAADFDPFCINRLYQSIKNKQEKKLLPLVINLAAPSPAIGVNNQERSSFIERAKVDLVLALALIHHLCIGKNIPFEMVAGFFSSLCSTLIIEFVPLQDEKVKFMLTQKANIYDWYTQENFKAAFAAHFEITSEEPIEGTERIMFLMRKR